MLAYYLQICLLLSCPLRNLPSELARINPSEILIQEELAQQEPLSYFLRDLHITLQPSERFEYKNGVDKLCKAFDLKHISELGPFSQLGFL